MRKKAILRAAQEAFSADGYSAASLRQIAERAGVTHGLIRKHFGSKEKLFIAAMPGTRDWFDRVRNDESGDLAQSAAAAFVERQEAGRSDDVLVAVIRSCSERDRDRALPLFRLMMETSHKLYDELVPGDDTPGLRTELLVSMMIGATVLRHVMGEGEIAELPTNTFRDLIEEGFRRLLAPPELLAQDAAEDEPGASDDI